MPSQTEYESGCDYDYLEIRDGGSSSATRKFEICGDSKKLYNGYTKLTNMPDITSTGNQLYLRFRTNSGNNRKGFAAYFMKGIFFPIPFYFLKNSPFSKKNSFFYLV